jgi:hypothetical protein
VDDAAKAMTSVSVRWLQWSTAAAPVSTAIITAGPGPDWLPCTRSRRPLRCPAASTRRTCALSRPLSQDTLSHRTRGAAASNMGPQIRSKYPSGSFPYSGGRNAHRGR